MTTFEVRPIGHVGALLGWRADGGPLVICEDLPVLVPDEALAAEALAADPDALLPDDSVSFWSLESSEDGALLPGWYMPTPAGGTSRHSRGRKRVVYLLVTAFLLINAAGLCSTYGHVVIA